LAFTRPVKSYRGLIEAFVARRKDLGLPQLEVDYRAGLPDGYTGKIEKYDKTYGRKIGPLSLDCMLGALGLELVVIERKKD
jgi:hypothetical protein